ncbi:zinc finger protein 570-like [Eupeodes corollae]|uniref:zinc finger protein 570-like n=1 Tax=Eupeodes corollae TaxID=290404 RepID=UPI002491E3CF|nr:zinc finger protein 570-like [Eupeodes corollae]
MDIKSIPICRVCMQTSPEYVDFDMPLQNENEEDTSITYLDFFFECTRIEVEPQEGESQCFCLPCGDELRSFYKFIKIAEMSDRILKSSKQNSSLSGKSFNTNNSDSYKINKLEHKKNESCLHVEDFKCTKNNTEEIIKCSNEETIHYLLKETNEQEKNTKHRLIKLKVEPFKKTEFKANDSLNNNLCTGLGKNLSENESNLLKNGHFTEVIETKLKRKKSKIGPAECIFCHEILRNQKLLDRHLIDEHQRRTKPCEICGKMVIRMRDHLLIHEREKHCIQRPKIECKICFRMISKQTISRHIRQVHHREIRKHKCSECSQTFADAHKLKVHILKGHNSRMNIKCLLCARKFENAISLNNHLRVHPCLVRVSKNL